MRDGIEASVDTELPPVRLYKYFAPPSGPESATRLERSIQRAEFYFSSPGRFNDLHDCKPSLKAGATPAEKALFLSRGMREHHPSARGHWRKQILDAVGSRLGSQQYMEQMWRDCVERYGVLCLSATATSGAMWAHYSNNHTGLCVALELTARDYRAGAFVPIRVVYADKRPEIRFMDLATGARGPRLGRTAIFDALRTKSTDWKYEAEWRIIDLQGHGIRAFSQASVVSVILGAQSSAATHAFVEQAVSQCQKPIPVLRTRPSSSSFEMELAPLGEATTDSPR